MLDLLPVEIIGIVCTHLDLLSVNNLRYTNSKLNKNINNSSNFIIMKELKKINNYIKPYNIYNFLTTFLKILLYKNINILYSRNYSKDNMSSNLLLKHLEHENILENNSSAIKHTTYFLKNESDKYFPFFVISYNKNINLLFKKILEHFIYYGNIENYDPINLLFLYNFIQIEQFNIRDLNYYINFIEDLTLNKYNRTYDNIINNYYKFLVKNLNYEDSFTYSQESSSIKYIDFLTLDQLYKISKWIITPHIIQKILSYKPLNLYTSEIMICCNLCFKDPLKKIINTKFNMRNNELIGHNYSLFKSLLINNKNTCINILKYIELNEKMLVNKYIYITDPKTNIKKRLTYLSQIDYNISFIIKKNQKFLINKIFNN